MLVLKHMVTEESAEALFAPCCLMRESLLVAWGRSSFVCLFFRNMSGEKKGAVAGQQLVLTYNDHPGITDSFPRGSAFARLTDGLHR